MNQVVLNKHSFLKTHIIGLLYLFSKPSTRSFLKAWMGMGALMVG
jgi:hypothetical protein